MTLVWDDFSRTIATGWGSTPGGLAWALTGAAADRSVSSGAGRVTLTGTTTTIRSQTIDRPWGDGEVVAHLRVGQVSEGGDVAAGPILRWAGSGLHYRARAVFAVDGTVRLDIASGTTVVGSSVDTGLTYTAGSRLRVRARVDGHRVRARVWPAVAVEPVGWMIDRTVTEDTNTAGRMGVFVSSFGAGAAEGSWVEVERVEMAYRLLVENTLAGPVGQQVTDARLRESALAGTVTARAPGAGAVYDDAHTVAGRSTVRIQSGGHRPVTPQLRVNLPSSGPWSARFYTWVPPLQDAGHGTGEVRSLVVWPTHAWVVHATAAANIGSRLQPPGLAAPAIQWDEQDGVAVPIGQWWRIEMRYTTGVLQVRAFPGHATTGFRYNAWTIADMGRTLDLTGFRWLRNRALVQWGSSGAEVRTLQHELVDLGYSLGAGGANGDFDERMHLLVQQVQRDLGVTPVDGSAGPETRSAIDYALGRVPPPLWVSHLAVADGEWIGPVEAPPPPPEVLRTGFTVGIPI